MLQCKADNGNWYQAGALYLVSPTKVAVEWRDGPLNGKRSVVTMKRAKQMYELDGVLDLAPMYFEYKVPL